MTDTHQPRPLLPAVLAALFHLAILPFYAATGLLAPGWAVVTLLAGWLVGTVVIVRLRRRGWRLLLVPGAAIAFWFAALTAGEQLLGWTA